MCEQCWYRMASLISFQDICDIFYLLGDVLRGQCDRVKPKLDEGCIARLVPELELRAADIAAEDTIEGSTLCAIVSDQEFKRNINCPCCQIYGKACLSSAYYKY